RRRTSRWGRSRALRRPHARGRARGSPKRSGAGRASGQTPRGRRAVRPAARRCARTGGTRGPYKKGRWSSGAGGSEAAHHTLGDGLVLFGLLVEVGVEHVGVPDLDVVEGADEEGLRAVAGGEAGEVEEGLGEADPPLAVEGGVLGPAEDVAGEGAGLALEGVEAADLVLDALPHVLGIEEDA